MSPEQDQLVEMAKIMLDIGETETETKQEKIIKEKKLTLD